jgi:hypothetical protein
MTLKKIGSALIILVLSFGVVFGIVMMILPSAQEINADKAQEKTIPLVKKQMDTEDKALADVIKLASTLEGDASQTAIDDAEKEISEMVDYLDAHWEKYDKSDEIFFNMVYKAGFLTIIARGNDNPEEEINKKIVQSNIGSLVRPMHDYIIDSQYIVKTIGKKQQKRQEEIQAERLKKIEPALAKFRQDKEGSVKEFVALLDARQ